MTGSPSSFSWSGLDPEPGLVLVQDALNAQEVHHIEHTAQGELPAVFVLEVGSTDVAILRIPIRTPWFQCRVRSL